jgi:glycosyltransferase involved in cell wall biosynthesis
MPVLVAILVERMGPYHAARFRALALRIGPEHLAVLEVAGRSQRYAWEEAGSGQDRWLERLFPDADYATLAPRAVGGAVRATLERLQPECVAVNGWGFAEARAAARWARARGRAVVLMSDSQERDAPRLWLKEAMKRLAVRRCDSALVAGRPHADYAARLGMDPARVVLGYDVVDNAHFVAGAAAARREAARLRGVLRLPERFWLVCARLVPKKNLVCALDAYARYLKHAGPQAWGLVVVGDGPGRLELERRAASLGISGRLILPGFVQYQELPWYYGLASAFLLPSTVEQWGLVVNEAMAAGLPVLVSEACGCAPELVHEGVNGFAFRSGDCEALARRMAQLASAPDLAAMGEASSKIIASWTPETFAGNMMRAVELALQHAATRKRR